MGIVLRLVRIVLLVVLTFLVVSFIIAIARPETGVAEKIFLAVMVAACFAAAAKLSSLALAIQGRLRRD